MFSPAYALPVAYPTAFKGPIPSHTHMSVGDAALATKNLAKGLTRSPAFWIISTLAGAGVSYLYAYLSKSPIRNITIRM